MAQSRKRSKKSKTSSLSQFLNTLKQSYQIQALVAFLIVGFSALSIYSTLFTVHHRTLTGHMGLLFGLALLRLFGLLCIPFLALISIWAFHRLNVPIIKDMGSFFSLKKMPYYLGFFIVVDLVFGSFSTIHGNIPILGFFVAESVNFLSEAVGKAGAGLIAMAILAIYHIQSITPLIEKAIAAIRTSGPKIEVNPKSEGISIELDPKMTTSSNAAKRPPHQLPLPLEAIQIEKPVKIKRQIEKRIASADHEDHWQLPLTSFLKEAPKKSHELNREDLIENSKNLENKLAEFGISGQVVAVRPGPVITMYEFKPGAGIKISQIASRADDLSLALEAQSVRIVAPIPGKSVVGIEIPNESRETVFLREILETEAFADANQTIPIAVGKDIAGAPVVTDIAATPHLLVAGSSGAGKSVFINTLITSLLYRFSPKDLRMIMVDPKQLELALYDKIPHLLLPVVDDPQNASTALRWAVNEMERRYTLMARAGVRNLKGFNQKLQTEGQEKMRTLLCPVKEDGTAGESSVSHLLEHNEKGEPVVENLPFILVIIDEFADLMMVAKKDIESNVSRLAAKARASGIHLIIATQRPSTDVITGVIKNNLPSRVGFKVPSQIDSRTILDSVGAEKLLGRGDMLFIPPGVSRLVRVHGAYIDEEEISKICDFWRQQGEPVYKEEILAEPEPTMAEDDDGVADPLYQQAITIVREEGQASASRLQRRLKVGYNRAARMIESMEAQGLVGPGSGSKPREVIY